MQEQETASETGASAIASMPATSATLNGLDALRAELAKGHTILAAAQILAAEDRRYRLVDVPEWNGQVIVRALSGTERDQFETSVVLMKGNERVITTLNIRAKLAALSIVDPTDPALTRRAFSDDQVAALGAKSSGALSRVYDCAASLSGISEADAEELAGNSAGAASDDSSPKSP